MLRIQKVILFLTFMIILIHSYASDSTSVGPINHPAIMHQVSKVDVNSTTYQTIEYTTNGDQNASKCDPNSSLVHIRNASKQVFWGPPKSICESYGSCSGFGCYCAGSPHSCCSWCSPPCRKYTQVKWQARPSNNQSSAIYENMPSVLSDVGCAPVKTVWEETT